MRFQDFFPSRRKNMELATSPYTEDLVQLLAGRFGIHAGERGAYVGVASTRLATLFLDHGYKLVATAATSAGKVELETLRVLWPELRVTSGTPETTNLPPRSVDFILSERALHRPHLDRIREEFRRILRPGGVVVLITDNRVYGGSAQQEAYNEVLRRHCPEFREKQAPAAIASKVAEFFCSDDVFEDAFVGRQSLTFAQLRDQAIKLPIFPRVEEAGHAEALASLEKYFADWSVDGRLEVPVVCRIACGHLGVAEQAAPGPYSARVA